MFFRKEKVCADCGCFDFPRRKTRGAFIVEVGLWLCFLLPGLIYSLWRESSRVWVCRACGSEHLLPPTSPLGRELMQKFYGEK